MSQGEIGKDRNIRPIPSSVRSITNGADLPLASRIGGEIIDHIEPLVGAQRVSRIDISIRVHLGEEGNLSHEGKIISIAGHEINHPRTGTSPKANTGCCELGNFWGQGTRPTDNLRPQEEFSVLEEAAAYPLVMPRWGDPNWFANPSLHSVATTVFGRAPQIVWTERSVKPGFLDKKTEEQYPYLARYIREAKQPTPVNGAEVSDAIKEKTGKIKELQASIIEKYRLFINSPDHSLAHLIQFDSWFRNAYPNFVSDQLIQVLQRVEPYLIYSPNRVIDNTVGWMQEINSPKEQLPDVDNFAIYAVKTRFVLDEDRVDYRYYDYQDRAAALKKGLVEGIEPDQVAKISSQSLARKIRESEEKLIQPLYDSLLDPSSALPKLTECIEFIKSDPFFAQFDPFTIVQILQGQLTIEELRELASA